MNTPVFIQTPRTVRPSGLEPVGENAMAITERRALALQSARRCSPRLVRALVSHFINTRAQGPQPPPPEAQQLVRRGWLHPNGRLTADGGIIGRACMAGEL